MGGALTVNFHSEWSSHFGSHDGLESLTLVVTTMGRHSEALRTINLMRDFPVSVLFLDNSVSGLAENSQRLLPANCRYFHHPRRFRWQQANLGRWVKTPFVVLVDDDNLPLPLGLCNAVEVMKSNPMLAACAAPLAGYVVNQDSKIIPVALSSLSSPGLRSTRVIKLKRGGHQIQPLENLSESRADRLVRQLYGEWRGQAWYAVQRTESLASMMRVVSTIGEFSSSRSSTEIALEAMTAWSGPAGYSDVPTQMRRQDDLGTEISGSDRWLSFDGWRQHRRYRNEYDEFVDLLVNWMDPTSPEEEGLIRCTLAAVASDSFRGQVFNLVARKLGGRVSPSRLRSSVRSVRTGIRGFKDVLNPRPDVAGTRASHVSEEQSLLLRWLRSATQFA
jgi:hypothetical protein